jgi:hypothetical protein
MFMLGMLGMLYVILRAAWVVRNSFARRFRLQVFHRLDNCLLRFVAWIIVFCVLFACGVGGKGEPRNDGAANAKKKESLGI